MTEDEIKTKIEENYGRGAIIYSSSISSKPIKGFISYSDKNTINPEAGFHFKSSDEKTRILVNYNTLELLLIGPFQLSYDEALPE